jgi:hypothetical protein
MRAVLFTLPISAFAVDLPAGDVIDMGTPTNVVHEVTIPELLSRSDFFDGQPVRLIGVADFNFSFEEHPSIFLSKDDARFHTYNQISIRSFLPKLASSTAALRKLSGKFVLVDGIFHANLRQKIGPSSPLTICNNGCLEPGYLGEVGRVRLWEN